MKKIMKLITLLGFFSLLSACSAQVMQMTHLLANKKSCCQSYAEMKYSPLPDRKELDVAISNHNPVYHFKTGNSYYASFKIPPKTKELNLETFIVGQVQPYAHIFYPYVLFLDKNFQKTHVVRGPFKFKSRLLKTPYLQLKTPVRENDRYMIVFTNPAVFKYYMSTQTILKQSLAEGLTREVGSMATKKSNNNVPIPYAAEGRLKIRLA